MLVYTSNRWVSLLTAEQFPHIRLAHIVRGKHLVCREDRRKETMPILLTVGAVGIWSLLPFVRVDMFQWYEVPLIVIIGGISTICSVYLWYIEWEVRQPYKG